MAASTGKPTRLNRIAYTTNSSLSSSSMTGARARVTTGRGIPTSSMRWTLMKSAAAAAATPAPSACPTNRKDTSLKLSITMRSVSRHSTGASAAVRFSIWLSALGPERQRSTLKETMSSRRGEKRSSNAAAAPTDSIMSRFASTVNWKSSCPPTLVIVRRRLPRSTSVTSALVKSAGRIQVK